ncbi:transglycosylase domain-containing protein [Chryseobacterium shandongense]|uniref:transglycosylase domain-containing protein n=1 Tax=Chryseobacterium shandongense TaxID=1493872 RepID=UPI000F4DDD53|nr:transglycosylase domain-containing protein [Chryseobacterium shandongense]AZA58125.1 hypothetical protein EG350_13435 [Chryseobacterium shandongense]
MMKYLKISIALAFTGIVLLFLYIEFGGRFIIGNYDKRIIIHEIRTSEKLPANFTNFYNTLYPNALHGNSWHLLLQSVINKNNQRKECPCNITAFQLTPVLAINNKKSIDQFVVARYLEHNYTQEECLAFNFSHFDFLENRKGISKLSQSLFKKDIKELQSIEIAEIVSLYENPVKNNRYRNPERAKTRAEYLNQVYINNLKNNK